MFPLARFTSNRSLDEARRTYLQRIEDATHIFRKYAHEFEERPCFVCGSIEYSWQVPFHDTFKVACCDHCGSRFVNPAPSIAALRDYYNNCESNRMLERIFRDRHARSGNYILDDRVHAVIERVSALNRSAIRILEIGCNNGSFLARLKQALGQTFPDTTFTLEGIDIDENAVANCVDPEVRLFASTAEAFAAQAGRSYDFILHFELIEHLVDPYRFMHDLRGMLSPEGYLIFTTPNELGLEMLATPYNGHRLLAHSIFPPMHLNAFNTANVTHFTLRCGYKIKSITTPGKLDVDAIRQNSEHLSEDIFVAMSKLDEDTLGLLQHIISRANASSHMCCVLQRSARP